MVTSAQAVTALSGRGNAGDFQGLRWPGYLAVRRGMTTCKLGIAFGRLYKNYCY